MDGALHQQGHTGTCLSGTAWNCLELLVLFAALSVSYVFLPCPKNLSVHRHNPSLLIFLSPFPLSVSLSHPLSVSLYPSLSEKETLLASGQ